jgi:ribose/xylose/arabinose/galactoside ABC-type transport system permease subunit
MFPFVVTLSTQLVYRGVAYLLSNAQSYLINSEAFRFIGVGKIGPIPVPVIIFFVLIIISHYLLAHTPFGRYVYAVGGNPEAARASGVNVKLVTLLVYVLMAVFTAISGVIMSSRVNAGQPNLGMGYETDAIAASVIGGVSFTGGIGTIPGTVIGVLIIGVINNAMNLLKVSSFWQMIAKGLIIVIAVLVDTKLNKREEVHIA